MSQHEDDDDGLVAIVILIGIVVLFLFVVLFFELKFAWECGFEIGKGKGWTPYPNLDGVLGGFLACAALLYTMVSSGFVCMVGMDLRYAKSVFTGVVNLKWSSYWTLESLAGAFARGFAIVNAFFLVMLAVYGAIRFYKWIFVRSASRSEMATAPEEKAAPNLMNVIRFPKMPRRAVSESK